MCFWWITFLDLFSGGGGLVLQIIELLNTVASLLELVSNVVELSSGENFHFFLIGCLSVSGQKK